MKTELVSTSRFRVALLSATALLGGCASVPDLGPQPVPRTAQSVAAAVTLATNVPATWPAGEWWRAYGDPQLDRLIEAGLADSPDLAAAVARVRSAQAQLREAGAPLGPRGSVNASAGGIKQSYNNGIPPGFVPQGINDTAALNLQLGFDLDLWGRNRAALRAARLQADAAAFDLQQARLVIATAIAQSYAQYALASADRAVAARAASLREQTRTLVQTRVSGGLDTQAQLQAAAAETASARGDVAALDEQIALARNSLAVLSGQGPDAGLALGPPQLALLAAHGIPGDATTELVARRPDIQSARALVESADQRIRVARADYYPSINLNALVGLQALGLGNLFKTGSAYGNAGPALNLPLFRGAELGGRYAGARAGFDEAVARYDGAVLTAYREAADAVASRAALAERLAQSRAALTAARSAATLTDMRYRGGLGTYLDVLTVQRTALIAERQVTDLEARVFLLDVQLVRALGGGFSPDAAATPPTKDMPHG